MVVITIKSAEWAFQGIKLLGVVLCVEDPLFKLMAYNQQQQGYGAPPGGYPGQPRGYAPQQPGGYNSQQPRGYPGQQQPGGYPGQQQPGGYPGQPGGYPPRGKGNGCSSIGKRGEMILRS